VIRTVLAILIIPFALSFLFHGLGVFLKIILNPAPILPFLFGGGVYGLIWLFILRRRKRGMWDTFEHELTHVIFCILCLKKVHSFMAGSKADQSGRLGVVYHEQASGLRGTLITLSPYFFPTYTAFLLLIRLFVADSALGVFDLFVGVTFIYHLISNWQEFGFHQSDITSQTKFFSVVFIILANLIIIPAVLLIVHGEAGSLLSYLGGGFLGPVGLFFSL
tara:strand:- start:67 stop:726 length:660 start_codon:yes stop_codon:yes gene_type:complete